MPLHRLASGRRLGVRERDKSGSGDRRFWPLPHAGHEISEADTHVESCGDVLSDAGSTPAASTTFLQYVREFWPPVPAASPWAPRLAGAVPASSSRIAASSAAGLRCIYRCVVIKS